MTTISSTSQVGKKQLYCEMDKYYAKPREGEVTWSKVSADNRPREVSSDLLLPPKSEATGPNFVSLLKTNPPNSEVSEHDQDAGQGFQNLDLRTQSLRAGNCLPSSLRSSNVPLVWRHGVEQPPTLIGLARRSHRIFLLESPVIQEAHRGGRLGGHRARTTAAFLLS